jgi:uncharacterized protein (TIGR03067 family)
MARTIAVAAFLALAALVVPAVWADDAKDASKLIGTWTVTSAEKDGKRETATATKGKQVKITRDTITCYDADGKVDMSCEYTVDTSKTPWQVEMTGKEGEHKGKKFKGIARLVGGTLTLCHAKPDGDSPTGFTTKEGQCCVTLERK